MVFVFGFCFLCCVCFVLVFVCVEEEDEKGKKETEESVGKEKKIQKRICIENKGACVKSRISGRRNKGRLGKVCRYDGVCFVECLGMFCLSVIISLELVC